MYEGIEGMECIECIEGIEGMEGIEGIKEYIAFYYQIIHNKGGNCSRFLQMELNQVFYQNLFFH